MNNVHVDVENGKPVHDVSVWAVNGPATQRSLLVQGATVSFHDLSYSVQVAHGGRRCQSVPKEILHTVR